MITNTDANLASHCTAAGHIAKLASPRGGVEITLDGETGLPCAFAAYPNGPTVPLRLGVELDTGGDETTGTTGGLTYIDTRRRAALELVPGSLRHTTNGPTEHYVIDTRAGEWLVRTSIVFRPARPRVELRVAVSPQETDAAEALLRNLYLDAELTGDLDAWLLEAPGNTLRPSLAASAFAEQVSIQTAGYELGSPGIVAVHHIAEPVTLIIWPMSRSEQGPITIQRTGSGLRLHYDTQLAGAVPASEWIEHGPIYLDVLPEPWDDVRRGIQNWYRSIGVQTPTDRPSWCSETSLYEVMIGSAPFRGGHHYAPYPSFNDLIHDLDRIADLGFDCLQLMPRHPYPSYNIHQPGDVATTYGTPDELRQLIDACHRRGLRILLDILLHGVIDKQAVEKTARLVRTGPHAKQLDDPCLDIYGEQRVEISWCRHILEFEAHWYAGAPDRHPLLDDHPDWFMRNSHGAITGRYTHALDIANHEWQECFIQTCETLLRDYSIDGFRFDAPFYNLFANWAPQARRHASYSNLSYVQLFHRLRPRLHAISPEVILYTEPSGPLARESLDLNYGYPESWLIGSLFDDRLDNAHDWRRVSTGRELAAWFRDFDATLPPGSATAHFVDCHDTIWWRLPGDLWRREQIGLPGTKALVAIYALRGGAYLTCAGGETDVEPHLKRVHALRTYLPEMRDGAIDYTSVSSDHDAIYAVVRHNRHRATLVAVNASAQPLSASVRVETAALPGQLGPQVLDAWTGEWLPSPSHKPAPDDVRTTGLAFELDFEPYQVRVLVLGHPPRELRP